MPKPHGTCDMCAESAIGMAKRGLFFMQYCATHKEYIQFHVYGKPKDD